MRNKARRLVSLVLVVGLFFQQAGFAQAAGVLSLNSYLGIFGSGAASQDKFRPVQMRYFSYEPASDNFKILLDKGDLNKLEDKNAKEEARTLLSYFLVGVALPDDAFWVNLRPDSQDQIIDPLLEKTEVGRIMLEADLQLKKDTSRMTSPQTPEGKAYWDKLYKKAGELFGTENITIPTITRPWIVPGEIIVRESQNSAYVYKAGLKVMLEEDYLTSRGGSRTAPAHQQYAFPDPRLKELNQYSTQLIKELIIPKLTKDINSSKRYASLRQVYYSLILSRWFKLRFAGKSGTYASLINARNLTNLTSQNHWDKGEYFNQYQQSFAKGEYNLKEQIYAPVGQSVRSYVSGGANWTGINPENGLILKEGSSPLGATDLLSGKAVLPSRIDLHPATVASPLDNAIQALRTKQQENNWERANGNKRFEIVEGIANTHNLAPLDRLELYRAISPGFRGDRWEDLVISAGLDTKFVEFANRSLRAYINKIEAGLEDDDTPFADPDAPTDRIRLYWKLRWIFFNTAIDKIDKRIRKDALELIFKHLEGNTGYGDKLWKNGKEILTELIESPDPQVWKPALERAFRELSDLHKERSWENITESINVIRLEKNPELVRMVMEQILDPNANLNLRKKLANKVIGEILARGLDVNAPGYAQLNQDRNVWIQDMKNLSQQLAFGRDHDLKNALDYALSVIEPPLIQAGGNINNPNTPDNFPIPQNDAREAALVDAEVGTEVSLTQENNINKLTIDGSRYTFVKGLEQAHNNPIEAYKDSRGEIKYLTKSGDDYTVAIEYIGLRLFALSGLPVPKVSLILDSQNNPKLVMEYMVGYQGERKNLDNYWRNDFRIQGAIFLSALINDRDRAPWNMLFKDKDSKMVHIDFGGALFSKAAGGFNKLSENFTENIANFITTTRHDQPKKVNEAYAQALASQSVIAKAVELVSNISDDEIDKIVDDAFKKSGIGSGEDNFDKIDGWIKELTVENLDGYWNRKDRNARLGPIQTFSKAKRVGGLDIYIKKVLKQRRKNIVETDWNAQLANSPVGYSAGAPMTMDSKQEENDFGGIDFRGLPMSIQPMGSFEKLNFSLPSLSRAEIEGIDVVSQIGQISDMVRSGISPSGRRVKELVAACAQKGQISAYADDLLACIGDILKLEEEIAKESSPELKEALAIAESV